MAPHIGRPVKTKVDIVSGSLDKMDLEQGTLIGLTADVATLAGGYRTTANNSYYLYTNQNYWLVSPCLINSSYAYEFYLSSSGTVHGSYGVRLVVSLSSELFVSGSGYWNYPYIVDM